MELLQWVGQSFSQMVMQGQTYLFLLPIYTGLLLGERLVHERTSHRKWDDRDGATNIFITVVYLLLDVVIGHILPLGLVAILYENFRIVTLGYTWFGWLFAFLLHDLTWYLDHRLSHRVGILWALHHVHHSSQEFNMTVASRGFWLDNSLARPLFYLLPLFGVSVFHFVVIRIITSVLGIAQHTRLFPKVTWLDAFFATPSNHRVHHGSNPKYIDRNYGEILIVWDRLFGTYQKEEEEPTYGVTEPIDTYNPFKIEVAGIQWFLQRFRSATNWQDKLRYLWKPPDWKHNEE